MSKECSARINELIAEDLDNEKILDILIKKEYTALDILGYF